MSDGSSGISPAKNSAAVDGEALPTVLESFLSWSENAPNAAALLADDEVVSYAELRGRTASLAARLRRAGVLAGENVAVVMPNGVEAVTAVLAILWSGAAYVPVSPKDPHIAITSLLSDAGVNVVCADGDASWIAKNGFTVVDPAPGASSDDWVDPYPVGHEEVAYLCYTSGSTGTRRGVVVDHGNLAHSTAARRETYPGRGRFYWMSPLNFDSSAAGLWGTLTSGGTLIVANETTLADRTKILRSLESSGATQLLCIPALYDAILRDIVRLSDPALPALQTVILAGEALPQSVADRHFEAFGTRVDLVNEYGPTECTIWATYRRLRPSETVTIGTPVPGVTIDVVTADLVAVEPGGWGQIMISGPTVTRGYRGVGEAQRSPFVVRPNGERAFLTGDLARVGETGLLEFGGRVDDQVKVRGHRVALGAVEQALLDVSSVRRAAVLQDSVTHELSAFVEVDEGLATSRELKQRLSERLPGYMVPASVDVLERLPVTSTGKLDRLALRKTSQPAPRSAGDAYKAVASAWSEVLGVGVVPAETSFFDAGGNSLLVFDLQDALAERMSRRPTIVELFAHPTILAQAQLFDRASGPASDSAAARLAAARRQRALRHVTPNPTSDGGH